MRRGAAGDNVRPIGVATPAFGRLR